MSFTVLVTRRIPPEGLELLQRSGAMIDLFDGDAPMPRPELLKRVAPSDGLLAMGADRIDAELFDAAPKLKVVSCFAVGYDNVDLPEATKRRVVVTNTPGVLTEACADLTWALMLSVARRVVEGDHFARSGNWRGWAPMQLRGVDFAGKTLGIVGAGRIGNAVARRATGFSMRVLTFTSRNSREDFDMLLRQSDFVSVHVPLTPQTRHLFGEREFRMMKPTAYFINMSRGPVHDEAALVCALREGWIAGAGLDVYEREPQIHPGLIAMPNVALLPHLGSATVETRAKMAAMAAENLLTVLRGEKCANQVNPF